MPDFQNRCDILWMSMRCDWSVVSPFSSYYVSTRERIIVCAFLSHPLTYYCAATVVQETTKQNIISHHPQTEEEKMQREKMMPLVVPTTAHYQSFLHSAYNSSIAVSPFHNNQTLYYHQSKLLVSVEKRDEKTNKAEGKKRYISKIL